MYRLFNRIFNLSGQLLRNVNKQPVVIITKFVSAWVSWAARLLVPYSTRRWALTPQLKRRITTELANLTAHMRTPHISYTTLSPRYRAKRAPHVPHHTHLLHASTRATAPYVSLRLRFTFLSVKINHCHSFHRTAVCLELVAARRTSRAFTTIIRQSTLIVVLDNTLSALIEPLHRFMRRDLQLATRNKSFRQFCRITIRPR